MGIAISSVTVRCRDLSASAHFYADLLGFERGQDLGTMLELFAPTDAWPGQVDPPPAGRMTVMLDQIDGGSQDRVDGARGVVLGLTVDDVDAVVERLRPAASGVRLEPTDQDYGVRDAAVLDPDGHEVFLSGPLAGAAP
ncbi:Glyoxalase/bleomycin resistance protein/dioxygenase [Beutenbergia cavernae DSM 12333]|uniref:Glyoxalase/bleomycin resistance protein/dioxygenase n=1 Tax=Beutenbergia cavernae (strain ATCC BAA-8 / DSM 12333 / CCUG 43141 / JCM 11478 / NBRC 16432 / NCIMB 13614 / HKI 0122) TaxID=471853 RepID=C5BWP4_BEUC1|nr:VOC family protein [Beutenbergia cavernae]ACQ80710.1 Glyoxalase/bleomycin resistance protein/dioxygenase [Beutenbergia cavernae DSM 12333]